jgi:hypothetical protein
MMKKLVWFGFAASLLGLATASDVRGDDWDKKTVITFSQPVEIPGAVLPAGTYTFKLADTMSDRHIVQVFSADGSKILATFMAIPDYRLTATDETVIRFREVPSGSPEAIRAWFYPGNTVGDEFVYPKPRAVQLAKAAKAPVPATIVEKFDFDALKTAPIVAITPDEEEVPVTAAIQTTPLEKAAGNSPAPIGTTGVERAHLPKTAGMLPMILLFGLGAIGVAFIMMFVRRPSAATNR